MRVRDYWSSTNNNAANAYNCNFNSGNMNPSNNNNKHNGFSVRLVQDSTDDPLLTDVYRAYYDARRHKRNTKSQLRFERNLEKNLTDLYYELRDRRYTPRPCICFVVHQPVKREVYASEFRDRIVHHLYCNYVANTINRQLIYDSYSCRKGKGTLFGVNRLRHYIRACSNNFTWDAWVLKIDISGYFMSIRRNLLLQRVLSVLKRKMRWRDDRTKDLVEYLTTILISKDPVKGSIRVGKQQDWDGLPARKCLSKAPDGVGLPIGDLTSQLFSNLYLTQLDHFVKRQMLIRYCGHYVDDYFMVSTDRERLLNVIPELVAYMQKDGLTLHPKKIKLYHVGECIPFLGKRIRPYYTLMSKRTTHKYKRIIKSMDSNNISLQQWRSLNSYLGLMRHDKAARLSQLTKLK